MELTETGIKYNGFYRGIVIKHLSNGKCKVYIPGVYPAKYSTTQESNNLPDAEQITPLFGGSNKGNGVFSYPNLGSIVIVGFWNGDQNLPFFFGSTLGGDGNGEGAQKQYPEARCETTPSSVESGDDARVHKIVVDHTTVKMWESGKIEIKVFHDRKYNTGDTQPDVGCQIDIKEDGNINIKASNQIHLDAPDIMIDTNKFTMNAQTMKINNGQGIEITTNTMKQVVKSQIDTYTKSYNQVSLEKYNVMSPTVKLDATAGTVAITSKNHPPIFA